MEKEDKLVAAKNEENAKISALSKLEPEIEPVPVIASEKPTPPPITLRHSYKKGKLYSNISMCLVDSENLLYTYTVINCTCKLRFVVTTYVVNRSNIIRY